MFPVPTVAPRAVAVAEKAPLLLKSFPKVDLITNPAFKTGKKPEAAVIKNPVPRTRISVAGPQTAFETASRKKENSRVFHHSFLKTYAKLNAGITKGK